MNTAKQSQKFIQLAQTSKSKISPENIANGEIEINVNETLGLKGRLSNSPLEATQDIMLAATSFIGVVLTVGIIWNGFKLVTSSEESKEIDNAKKALTKLVIGWLIVTSSALIIYLVQFIAKRA